MTLFLSFPSHCVSVRKVLGPHWSQSLGRNSVFPGLQSLKKNFPTACVCYQIFHIASASIKCQGVTALWYINLNSRTFTKGVPIPWECIIIYIIASFENVIRMQLDLSRSLKNKSFLQFDFATINTCYKHRSKHPTKSMKREAFCTLEYFKF